MDKPLNSFGQEELTDPYGLDDTTSSLSIDEVMDKHPELAAKLVEHRQETGYE
jgi:hypothetical protein